MSSIEELKGLLSKKGGPARSNLFQVQLPQIPFTNMSMRDINLVCRDVNLPGRQIASMDRTVGGLTSKIAYGQMSEDISLTFLVTNDYGIRKYFEAWQELAVNPNTLEVGYKEDYAKEVRIIQMAKTGLRDIDESFSTNIFNIDFTLDVNIDLPEEKPIYEVNLINAYPTTMNAINLNNDANGLVELNVQLSYDRWLSK